MCAVVAPWGWMGCGIGDKAGKIKILADRGWWSLAAAVIGRMRVAGLGIGRATNVVWFADQKGLTMSLPTVSRWSSTILFCL
jgi:hypothetical protein